MSTTSPNMNLVISSVGVDSGLNWETNLNSSLSIIDGHNHTSGAGVQIPPAGLNINSDLPMGNNNLTLVRSVRFNPQGAPLAAVTDLGCLYESGVDLYFNDGSGNQIRITQSGAVSGSAGTITGLPSGTASASFAASTFTFQSATLTPANIDGGSVVLRNNLASSKGLTLSPPNAMAANYSLTLPSVPASTSYLSIDTSGNISSYAPVVPAPQSSSSSGSFSTTSGSFVNVTNLSTAITTSGRPVMVMLMPASASESEVSINDSGAGAGTAGGYLQFLRDGTVISLSNMVIQAADNSGPLLSMLYPTSSFQFFDTGASSASHTYTVQVKANGASSRIGVLNASLVVYEIK